MDSKTQKITIGVLILAVVGLVFFQKAPVVTVTSPAPVVQNVGAVSGPDISSEYLRWGTGYGIRVVQHALPLRTGSTTVCSIQSPLATSTLVSGGVSMTVSSTTASTVTLAKALGPGASTTLIGAIPVAANAQVTLVASSTPTVYNTNVFSPGTWFNVTMTGGQGTFSPTGVCHATFEEYLIGA